jgi:predicted ArsR family transcriptional regulator
VKNSTRSQDLGPLPATTPEEQPPRARAAVLDALRTAPTPQTLAALGAGTGLHVNTLREHLEALVEAGLVRRRRADPHGRGRPAWLYAATRAGTGTVPEYAGLAAALAEVITRTSERPWDDAVQAGTGWGRSLTRPAALSEQDAREEVVALLEDLRFAPEPQEHEVRLTRCPLLDAAKRFPDVVCGVHLGIVRGALEQLGADPSGTTLQPFAEPGACRLSFAAQPR